MMKVSEQQFAKLCEDVYLDREQIYNYNPSMNRVDCLEWMILGCLITLLSIEPSDQSYDFETSTEHPYGEVICKLLHNRMTEPFDAKLYLNQLRGKISME